MGCGRAPCPSEHGICRHFQGPEDQEQGIPLAIIVVIREPIVVIRERIVVMWDAIVIIRFREGAEREAIVATWGWIAATREADAISRVRMTVM